MSEATPSSKERLTVLELPFEVFARRGWFDDDNSVCMGNARACGSHLFVKYEDASELRDEITRLRLALERAEAENIADSMRLNDEIDRLRAADEPKAQHPFAVARQSAVTPDDWSVHWPNSSVGNFSHSEARMWAAHMSEAYEAGRRSQPPTGDLLWRHCHVTYYPPSGEYPMEHNPHAGKDSRAMIEAALLRLPETKSDPQCPHGMPQNFCNVCVHEKQARLCGQCGKNFPPECRSPSCPAHETSERKCECDTYVPSLDEDYCALCAGKL